MVTVLSDCVFVVFWLLTVRPMPVGMHWIWVSSAVVSAITCKLSFRLSFLNYIGLGPCIWVSSNNSCDWMCILNFFELLWTIFYLALFRTFSNFKLISSNFTTMQISCATEQIRLRCCSAADLCGPKEPCTRWGFRTAAREGALLRGHMCRPVIKYMNYVTTAMRPIANFLWAFISYWHRRLLVNGAMPGKMSMYLFSRSAHTGMSAKYCDRLVSSLSVSPLAYLKSIRSNFSKLSERLRCSHECQRRRKMIYCWK